MDKHPGLSYIYAVWVYTSNLERSVDFYRNKVGLSVRALSGDRADFDLGVTSFAVLRRPPDKGPVFPSKTRIMFGTDDLKSLQEKLAGQGVTFIGGIREEADGCLLTFEDPDGHWLEVYQKRSGTVIEGTANGCT